MVKFFLEDKLAFAQNTKENLLTLLKEQELWLFYHTEQYNKQQAYACFLFNEIL